MPGFDVPLQISPAHQHFPTELAPVRSVSLRVQSDVFVEIAGITKGPKTDFTFEWFVTCMSPHVNLQAVFSRVQFATVKTQVSLFRFPRVWDGCGNRLEPRTVFLHGNVWQLLRVHRYLPVDVRNWIQVWIESRCTEVGHGVGIFKQVAEVKF